MGQRLGGGKQLLQPRHAQQPGAAEGGVIHRVRSRQRAGVRGRRLRGSLVAAGFHHDHRARARGGPRGGHEFPRRHRVRRADAFDIEQDGTGAWIARGDIQQVAEIDIHHVAEGNHRAKPHPARRCPVHQPGGHRAGLGEAGDGPGLGLHMAETGIHPGAGHDEAQAVRPDDAQQGRACRLQHVLAALHADRCPAFAKARRDHHRAGTTALRQLSDQARHRVRRRGDHREIGVFRQRRDIGPDTQPVDLAAMRIDRHQRPGKPRRAHVGQHEMADAARPGGGTDQGYRARSENTIEIADGHFMACCGWIATL